MFRNIGDEANFIQAPFFGSTYAIPIRHTGVSPILGASEINSLKNL